MADKPGGDSAASKEETVPAAQPAASAAAPAAEAKGKAPAVEEYPDPDEDDLDDLDDMLDDFSFAKPALPKKLDLTPSAGPSQAAPAAPTAESGDAEELAEDEFARHLQAGMADLLGDMSSNPEMQAQFEFIFKELGAAAQRSGVLGGEGPATGPSAPAPAPQPATGDDGLGSFQDNIRRTMERMQASGDSATAAATADSTHAEEEADILAEFMRQASEPGGENVTKVLQMMMEQLTTKDVLYEPMKELNEKFPPWLAKNKKKSSTEDMKRYEEQHQLVAQMVAKFEEPTFKDENPADREYIVDKMQKMQAAGSPPDDLMGTLPTFGDIFGLNEMTSIIDNAPEDMDVPESCRQQ